MNLEEKAIERIKTASEMSLYHYGKPLVCTYSGGKDSDVMLELFIRSGIPFEVVNSHTTVDTPQTVYHIRKKFQQLENKGIKCKIHMPEKTMWELIEMKTMPPTRKYRYCCDYLKENSSPNRFVSTGVRWDESKKRAARGIMDVPAAKIKNRISLMNDNDDKRLLMERCKMQGSTIVNPIIDWKHKDIWDYIRSEKIIYNPMYDMGYKRVGCVGCPLAGKIRYKEFADFPTYKRAYIRAFDRMLQHIYESGNKTKWKTGYDVFLWWMEDKNIEGQISLFEDEYANKENIQETEK